MRQKKLFRQATVLLALMLGACTSLCAQKDQGYVVTIKLHAGGAPLTGFLHSVTDSSVTIIAGMGGRKAFERALEHPRQISIPLSLIKKVSVTRVKTFAHALFASMGIIGGYSLIYALFIPITTPAGTIIYLVTVGTASLFTAVAIYTRKYRPTEPGFTIAMQKYCLVKSGLVVDGQ